MTAPTDHTPINAPTPNIPLLRKAVEWAEAEAAKIDGTCRWDQKVWASRTHCGTSYCLAGYTVLAAMPNATTSEDAYDDLALYIDGEFAQWGDTAQRLLGITTGERLNLFEGMNTIEDVRLFAELIAERAGERL